MRPAARWWLSGALALALAIALAGAAAWLRSEAAQRWAGRKLTAWLEETTGGRVEAGAWELDLWALRARVAPFVLHGTEPAGAPPLFRAASVAGRLRLVSLWRAQAHLEDLKLERPELRVRVDAQGRTNFPAPRRARPGGDIVADLLALAVDRCEARDGAVEWNGAVRRGGFAARGLAVRLGYQGAARRYAGELQAQALELPELPPVRVAGVFFTLGAAGIEATKGRLESGAARVEFSGALRDYAAPRAAAAFRATLPASALPGRALSGGTIEAAGEASYVFASGAYAAQAQVRARDVGWREGMIAVHGIALEARAALAPGRLRLDDAVVRALGGTLRGSAEVRDWQRLHAAGRAAEIDAGRIVAAASGRPLPWSGTLAGDVELDARLATAGLRELVLKAQIEAAPAAGALPLRGAADIEYRQADGVVRLAGAWAETPGARLNLRGELGRELRAGLTVTHLADVLRALRAFTGDDTLAAPFALEHGEARFTGTVTGPLDALRVSGTLSGRNVVVGQGRLDEISADLSADASACQLRNVRARQGATTLAGEAQARLKTWRIAPESALEAHFRLAGAAFEPYSRGRIDVSGSLGGTLETLQAGAEFTLHDARLGGEHFKEVRGSLRFGEGEGEQLHGTVDFDSARLQFDGRYRHARADYRNGALEARVALKNFALARSERAQALVAGLAGTLGGTALVRVKVENGALALAGLEGDAAVEDLAQHGGKVGRLWLRARPDGGQTQLEGALELHGKPIRVEASLALRDKYLLAGRAFVPRIELSVLDEILRAGRGEPLAAVGEFEGQAAFQVPLAELEKGAAQVRITQLRVRPRETQVLERHISMNDLTLHNEGALEFDVGAGGVYVRRARLTGPSTDLTLAGSLRPGSRSPWDMNVEGNINLAVLAHYVRELEATGVLKVKATLRGAAADPVWNGRAELNDASFYLTGHPTGLDKVSGLVMMERNRANLEQLTGQIGGGTFRMNGFLGVAGGRPAYQLRTQVAGMRVRYPEGVSTTVDADLVLGGSGVRSVLSGNVTVLRTAVAPGFDPLRLTQAAAPPVTGATSEFLRGMQFDVRVRSLASTQFQSGIARDVRVDADLQLRGSLVRPYLLGKANVTQGTIELFATRYNVARGELLFYSTSTLAPSIDVDLETRERGVTVSIRLTGQLNKLNVAYRSDPPMQTSDILALLAAGRTPSANDYSLGTTMGTRGPGTVGTTQTGSALVGAALTASLSGRLERFFGSSRIKIDPQRMGVDNVPEARVMLEQSISKDVTITYVTNVRGSQQQVVRLEWNLSKQWSMVAVRDENGVLGLELLLRKQKK